MTPRPPHTASVAPDPERPNGARLLTAEELAERWQVAKAQVYRLAREGELPTTRIGRYMRFRLEAVEDWERGGGSDG